MIPPYGIPLNFVHEIGGEILIRILCQIQTK